MEISVVNIANEVVGSIDLNPQIFGLEARRDVLKEVVNWQLAKRRSGTHKTKGISDISGTTAKPYRQKHTGRARQGSLRSPQFRGGAVIFGPVVRSHAYSLNKKVRRLGLKVALSMKAASNKLVILDSMDVGLRKTAEAKAAFGKFSGHRSYLVVSENYKEEVERACMNLRGVDLMKCVGINVLDILKHDCVMLTVDTVKALENRLCNE
ncbi:50S ribosomal protein L4 [Candidatus Anaplasma sp. TIGMIC]|uniref:50S ribosomal protein L4 n=1 Tax=Candidatus Anaplasma sp. TIGMIC TaxID=3020713 RepID=UPI002330BE32|nr:50S ribosomal protein L4 [Candidatus Anaplasma sp. TIGMIC]MDB1135259.1 50S ribosomal protein L4 [Candidatus Anaplasma sp. TIGMIC]